MPQEEPIITEIPDDDDEINDEPSEKELCSSSPPLKKSLELLEEVTGGVYTSIANESDIQILEPAISFMDLDQIEDEPENLRTVEESSQISLPVKIKKEPRYDGYEEDEEDAFEVVGTFEDSAINLMDETSGKLHIKSYLIDFSIKSNFYMSYLSAYKMQSTFNRLYFMRESLAKSYMGLKSIFLSTRQKKCC